MASSTAPAWMTPTACCSQTCREGDPHVDTLTWRQTANTVSAGKTLTINAANIENLNGTLAAWGDVTLTAGSSATNQAGAIQSLAGDISITAPTLVNKTMDPVTLHKSYGNMNPSYAGGCNPGGTYKESNCSANETTAAGPAGVISAARDVNLSGTALTNTGALITGGRDVTIKVDAPVNNNSIALNAEWVGRWVEKTGTFSSDKRHDTGGTAVLGSIESGIQAGNKLSVNAGGQITNTGNLMGATVDLTGAALVNGYTSPTQPTPPSTIPRQVIPLGPAPVPAGSLPPGTPAADSTQPWQFNPVIVTTPATPDTGNPNTVQWHFNANLGGNPVTGPTANSDRAQYVSLSPATAMLAGVTPDSLLKQLPPELRPGTLSFYYDPYTEGQKLQQAALQQTGQATFIDGLAWDNEYQLSVTDQQKLVLYQNAAEYAKEHSIALGTALTQQQINELDKPLLWYVRQQVPDPSCNTVASTVCPSVIALVPQVYLPDGYAQMLTKPTGGTIAGDNVSLDIAGQIRNSGQVMAGDTLKVKAGSIDNAPNVVDIGTSAYRVQGGWNVVTGTVVQPGGFMTAMNMDIEADSINAVNDAFRVMRADGSLDVDATNALVAELKANLGLNYTEGAVSDDIHQEFIKEKRGLGPIGQIVAIVAAVAISIATAGAGSALVGAVTSTAFAATATGAALAVAASGLIAGTLSSMASQLILTGSLDMGAALKAGVVSGVMAGLTQGMVGALGLGNAGITSIGDNIAKGSWEAVQANLGNYLGASIVRSAISAGVSTVAYGGSFGQAFASGLVRDAAAVFANAIGVTLPGVGTDGASTGTVLANMAGHALLGCAAQSLLGGDCAAGAVGGAASALAAPLIRDGLYDGSQTVVQNAEGTLTTHYDNTAYNATTVALATLIGGLTGQLLDGGDATSAALASQNEALSNSLSDKVQKLKDWARQTYSDPIGDLQRWGKEFVGMLPGQTPPTDANPLVDATNGGNPPATGGAVVAPGTMACSPTGQCVVTPPVASPGAAGVPSNATLSSGDSGSGPNLDTNEASDKNGSSFTPLTEGGGLQVYEDAGGHLIARHVGLTDAELASRLTTSNASAASTFADRATAESAVSAAINSNRSAIQSYLSGNSNGYLAIEYTSPTTVGTSLNRGATRATSVNNVRVVIAKDPTMSTGYRIVTGYPYQ